MSPITPYKPTQKEIDEFKAIRKSYGEGHAGKVDDFLPSSGISPTRKSWSKPKMSGCTPTKDNRPDEWLGSPSTKKRSWKVKEIKNLPNLELDDE